MDKQKDREWTEQPSQNRPLCRKRQSECAANTWIQTMFVNIYGTSLWRTIKIQETTTGLTITFLSLTQFSVYGTNQFQLRNKMVSSAGQHISMSGISVVNTTSDAMCQITYCLILLHCIQFLFFTKKYLTQLTTVDGFYV